MAKKEDNTSSHSIIYTYDISKLPSSTKVRFVYVLKGRSGEKGLVEELGGKFLVPGCFMIPAQKHLEIDEVFKIWNIRPTKYEVNILTKNGK